MSFKDDLKRSLGYDESEIQSSNEANKNNATSNISQMFKNLTNSSNHTEQRNPQQQNKPRPKQAQNPQAHPRPTPIYDDDDYVIVPEQPFYEIILIRPKTIDDVNYVVDQVIEERNPVIVDLSFLERESPANFRWAGEKIKQMRENYNAQALLLARTEDKNLIIISPRKVSVVNKG